jgi:hypothetical protein
MRNLKKVSYSKKKELRKDLPKSMKPGWITNTGVIIVSDCFSVCYVPIFVFYSRVTPFNIQLLHLFFTEVHFQLQED